MINIKFEFSNSWKYEYCRANIHCKNRLVGYSYLSLDKDYVWIDILNINPKFRWHGYGRKFIEFLTATSDVRWEHTVTSKGFYEKVWAKVKGNEFYFHKSK